MSAAAGNAARSTTVSTILGDVCARVASDPTEAKPLDTVLRWMAACNGRAPGREVTIAFYDGAWAAAQMILDAMQTGDVHVLNDVLNRLKVEMESFNKST